MVQHRTNIGLMNRANYLLPELSVIRAVRFSVKCENDNIARFNFYNIILNDIIDQIERLST